MQHNSIWNNKSKIERYSSAPTQHSEHTKDGSTGSYLKFTVDVDNTISSLLINCQ